MIRWRRLLQLCIPATLLLACDDDTTSTSTGGGGASSSGETTGSTSSSVVSTTTTAATTTTSSTGGGPACGDGVVDPNEGCDDGGTVAGDGCDDGCAVEAGFACDGAPSQCAPICGDGLVVGTEGCDDQNATSGDGCDGCAVEAGYACDGAPSICGTVCGDGLVVGAEQCDDANAVAGDGCDDACVPEHGFLCTQEPSVCLSSCGDGLIASDEDCDDGDTADGDGCSSTCATESGYLCANEPSACATVCGDGIVAGLEGCDDGNVADLDGCSSTCVAATGEGCADPLAISQATFVGGAYTWSIPAGSVVNTDASMPCDVNTLGPDVVLTFTKTSDTVANGGQLLHVRADTSETSTSYYFNVEVVSGSCDDAVGTIEKCLWYKHDWDAYLDLPPGTYFVFVQKNSPATASVPFPATSVTIEEVAPAAAEGEGCFAPYDDLSAIYTPPATPGGPHTWTLPASINSFDMGPEWGEPGSISCDNTSPYGDIHGVDAVIEFDKTSPTSVLLVQATNLDPVLSSSDLDLEVMNVCEPTSPARVTRNCRANSDGISITAPSPAGPVYVWVSTEATGEEFDGASVQITEIFPGPGESWPTAEPIAGSGPITPNSTMRLDPPSCMPPLGNVHWYAYTLQNDAVSIGGVGVGPVGAYDESGQQIGCVTDGSSTSIGLLGAAGDVFYIAVPSGGAVTGLTIADLAYNGVGSVVKDLEITFPTSATADQGMAVGAGTIFLGTTSKIFAFSDAGAEVAKEFGTADGITTTHLGYDLAFGGGGLFSVDSTTTTTASRLFRVFDGTTWGPVTWDLTPTYAASSPSHAITTDGSILLMSTRRTTVSADFYSFPLSAPASPVALGTNTTVWYVTGIAADSQYLYVASNGVGGEGVYRLSRAAVGGAAVKIASINTDTLTTNIEVDDVANASVVYVRSADGDTFAIVSPASASPTPVIINTLGTASDRGMTYDHAAHALYLFETETDSAGRIVQIK